MSAEDALRFLGRKPNGHYQGDATADLKRRPEGLRVKFRMKRNSIKMYDKWSVLRIETTIDNPREFKILRRVRGSLRWMRMAKGVTNFWRLNQLGQSANARFLQALGSIQPTHQAAVELDRLSRGRIVGHKRVARLNPVSPDNARLFAAALHGRHLLNGTATSPHCSTCTPRPLMSAAAASAPPGLSPSFVATASSPRSPAPGSIASLLAATALCPLS
jgi:hypothetical protein